MKGISLDQVMRDYYGRQKVYEILNSEGPILSVSVDDLFRFKFHREKCETVTSKEDVVSFLKGDLEILSPAGVEFSLSPEGDWFSMIQKGAKDLLEELEK